jgi:predicted PurR-regulated permease PerM
MRSEAWRWLARGTGATVGALTVAAIAAVLLTASHVLVLVAISILLAAGLEPAVGWLRGRTGLGRSTTILLVYAAFMALVAVLVFLIVPAAVSQLTQLSNRLPALLADARTYASGLRPAALADGLTSAIDALASTLRDPQAAADPGAVVQVGLAIGDAFVSVVTVLTLVFFWLTGHQRLQRFTLALLPVDHRGGVRHGWNEVETRLGLWVRGQAILMGTIFALTTVAYFVLGLPNALLLGVIAGLAEIIPIVGPLLGAIPALLVAAVTGQIDLVLLVAGVYVVIQVVEGNVLVPMVMKSTIGVPPFLVVVSLVIGAAAGGLVGALLAVPLVAAVVVILERAQDRETTVTLEGSVGAETPTEGERDDMGEVSSGQPRTALNVPAPPIS